MKKWVKNSATNFSQNLKEIIRIVFRRYILCFLGTSMYIPQNLSIRSYQKVKQWSIYANSKMSKCKKCHVSNFQTYQYQKLSKR